MPTEPNESHDPALRSWVESANDPATDFPIQNLPWCVFAHLDQGPYLGMAIGDQVVNLHALDDAELFDDVMDQEILEAVFGEVLLLPLLLMPEADVGRLVDAVRTFLLEGAAGGQQARRLRQKALLPQSEVEFMLPVFIGDYTDFYASIDHATTVGSMFRPDNPLLPNYKWVPIGYHGRSSSIVVSGAEIRRPNGQRKADDPPGAPFTPPTFGPTSMLDYELELGFIVGAGNEQGEPLSVDQAEESIFGLCLVNDWSARDVQKWEYQPLGPFLAKNFATTISPFIVRREALAPFRCPAYQRPADDPPALPYLRSELNERRGGYDITVEAWLSTARMREKGMAPVRLSRGSTRGLYWTPGQLLAHHTSSGCNLQPGDLIASGTISGPAADARGCLLELTWQGRDEEGRTKQRKPVELPSGEKRLFLEDGDEVILRGSCERAGFRRIGFGECRGTIIAAT